MAAVGQAATHFPQPSHQGPLSIAYASGTARSEGLCAALRSARPAWKGSAMTWGQAWAQRSQEMQSAGFTYRGSRRMVTR